jgi:flavin-dependent dehydrogenase
MCRVAVAGDSRIVDGALFVEDLAHAWWYLMPAPDGGWFAGFALPRASFKGRRETLRTIVTNAIGTSNLAELVAIHPIPPFWARPGRTDRSGAAFGEGWLALGDAALISDPLSGEGVEFAVESAVRGADAVAEPSGVARYGNWVNARAHETAQMGASLRQIRGTVTNNGAAFLKP